MKATYEIIIRKKGWLSKLPAYGYIYDELVDVSGESEKEIDDKIVEHTAKICNDYEYNEKTMTLHIGRRLSGLEL